MAREVLSSAAARARLPRLIEELLENPDQAVEIGRQRRREVVLVAASRFDELVECEAFVADIAWSAFACERAEHPTSAPVAWKEALRRRAERDGRDARE